MNCGKVWLVGAGPGETDLLTIKGKKAIEQAEVVVYDRLVGQGILAMIPSDTRCIDVGKCAGNHTMSQNEINQILLKEALQGKKVVRLKGGDPFLFGRGGEELVLLAEYNIPYEVVPGITSAMAVPAYHGIPVTHRDYASSVHVITGHRREGKSYNIDFSALVAVKGTLVFLMGVSALGDICRGLLEAGIDKDMPAALLQKGTTAKQKRMIATVSTLEQKVKEQGAATPAIIIVGRVCELAEVFSWYEKRPLSGCRILITRPKELISTLSEKLKEKGAEVLEIPAIEILPIKENKVLKKALHQLAKYQWLVFTSPSGVEVFLDRMKEEGIDIRRIGRIKIAVVGLGTKKKLEEKGIYADYMPNVYDGKALGELIGSNCRDGDHILIPRGKRGNQELIEEIVKRHQVVIEDIPTYDTVYRNQDRIGIQKEFEQGNIDYVMFTSSSTVKGFVEITKGLDYRLVKAVCIGKQTEEEAKQYNMVTYRGKEATIDSLIEVAETFFRKKDRNE